MNAETKSLPTASNPYQSRSREHGMSVFHCELPPGAYMQTDECIMSVQQCAKALNGWCEAGTRTFGIFVKMLKGTVYEHLAAQLQDAMVKIQELTGIEMTKFQRDLQTNWCHLSRFSGALNQQTDSSKDNQIVAKELVNFVGCLCQLLLSVVQHLGQFINGRGDGHVPHVSEAFLSLPVCQNPIQHSVGSRPNVVGNRSKAVGGGGSPAGLRKQVTSFILSKIGQKSPDTSCFYVPLDTGDGTSAVVPGVQSVQVSSSCSNNDIQGKSNGHVATQEDLDLVISMLSQQSRGTASEIKTIPENLKSGESGGFCHLKSPGPKTICAALHGLHVAGQNSLSGLNSSGTGMSQIVGSGFSKTQALNQSLGFVEKPLQNFESEAFSADAVTKTNTWPFKVNQKSLWPGVGDLRMMHNIYGIGNNESLMKYGGESEPQQVGTWPVNSGHDLGSAALNTLPSWYGGLWSSVNTCDMNGIWPSQYLSWNTDGMNSLSKSVSTVVESSSGSEESSSIVDQQQWGTGNQVQRRRRHSSGEHSLLSQHTTLSNTHPGIHDTVDKSADEKFGWTGQSRMLDKMTNANDHTGHRALSMQWSDPLTNRTLSCWDSDILSATESQSSTNSNASGSMKPTPSGVHLDKSF